MGTPSHHLAEADEFLNRADQAIDSHHPHEAAVALRRAASHATAALAVHQGWKYHSRRQLEFVLQANIADETLSRSHLTTLRQAHTLPNLLEAGQTAVVSSLPLPSRERVGVRGKSQNPHPVNPAHPCTITLRRMRRRVSSLITHAIRLIAGRPKPVRHHKRFLRQPDYPADPTFTSIQDILQLPNFEEIRQEFRLFGAPLAAEPDPHGRYDRGDAPRRCQCHAHLWDKPQDPHRITLSPLWRRALEKTFRIQLPNPLHLSC